jgi:hypothetical protein
MSDQHIFLPVDSYSRSQTAEHMLNTAITQAKISESFEEYLEIFDKFYADEVEVKQRKSAGTDSWKGQSGLTSPELPRPASCYGRSWGSSDIH